MDVVFHNKNCGFERLLNFSSKNFEFYFFSDLHYKNNISPKKSNFFVATAQKFTLIEKQTLI